MKHALLFLFFVGVSLIPVSFSITREEGAAIFKKAKEGNAESQYQIGECFRKGDAEVKKSFVQARIWYEKAAAQNHFKARVALAATPVSDPKLPLKGTLSINKSATPFRRESLGIELVNMLGSTTNSAGKPVDLRKVGELITKGADLNVVVGEETATRNGKTFVTRSGATALEKAVDLKDIELVKLLLANGADPHAHYFHLFHNLFNSAGHVDRTYRNSPPQSNKEPRQQLDKTLEIAGLLFDYGLNPNSWDLGGNTWMHWVCTFGSPAMVDLMVRHGADIDLTGDMSRSEDPKNPFNDGKKRSGIYDAITMGQVDAVRAILKHNPNLAFRDADGKTPLDHADEVRRSNNESLMKGTNATKGRQTVIDMTKKMIKRLDEIIDLLEAAGAKRSS